MKQGQKDECRVTQTLQRAWTGHKNNKANPQDIDNAQASSHRFQVSGGVHFDNTTNEVLKSLSLRDHKNAAYVGWN